MDCLDNPGQPINVADSYS